MPHTVVFSSETDQSSWIVPGITHASPVGTDTSNRKKADILLHTLHGDRPVSLKDDSAECWESGDRVLGPVFHDLYNRSGARAVEQKDGTYRLDAAIATRAPTELVEQVVFGSDILEGDGAVLCRSFSEDDLGLTNGNHQVHCTKIIRSISEVLDDVWIMIRNDRTRNSKWLPRGLRGLAVARSRVSGRTQVVYNVL